MSDDDEIDKNDLKSKAASDHKGGQEELLEGLKTYSKSELYQLDPNLLARLTPHQRVDLFSGRSNQSPETQKISKGSDDRPYRQTSRVRQYWNKLPLTIRAIIVGMFFTVCVGILTAFILDKEYWFYEIVTQPKNISSNSNTWPNCPRLTPYTDGCLYTVTHQLPWVKTIDALRIESNDLVSVNTHLSPASPIERGQRLIVWRNKISLEN